MHSFQEMPLTAPILAAMADMGLNEPTGAQAEVIPLILSGIDLIAQSPVGSGKTTASLIAMAHMLEATPGRLQALVLTPNKELATQIQSDFERLAFKSSQLAMAVVHEGGSMADQAKRLQSVQAVVATPGRLLDMLRRKSIGLSEVRILVVDDADDMVSLGLHKDVEAIAGNLPAERQGVVLCSSLNDGIRSLASALLSYPEVVSYTRDWVGLEETRHLYYMISGVGRLRDLYRAIEGAGAETGLVFCNNRDDSFHVANYLKREGYPAEVLTADSSDEERKGLLAQMKAGHIRFTVATDPATRGQDLSFVSCAINYVFPETPDVYMQRVERIGRRPGKAMVVSLISPKEIGAFYQLRRSTKLDLSLKSLPTDEEILRLKEKRALDEILRGLDGREDLDYGRFLSFADAFVNLPDWRKRLAKLMCFFNIQRTTPEPRRPTPAPQPASEAVPAAPPASRTTTPAVEPAPRPEAASKDRKRSGGRNERRGSRRERDTAKGEGGRHAQGGVGNAVQETTGSVVEVESARELPDARAVAVSRERGTSKSSRGDEHPSMSWIRLNMTRDRSDGPEQIRTWLAELSGMELGDLGTVQFFDDGLRIEVREDFADDIIAAVNDQFIGEQRLYARR